MPFLGNVKASTAMSKLCLALQLPTTSNHLLAPTVKWALIVFELALLEAAAN
jgi:hypothetical protein